MLTILKYVSWIAAVTVFIASGYFTQMIYGLSRIVVSINENVWGNIPIQFQWLILGLIAALIFLAIRTFTKDN